MYACTGRKFLKLLKKKTPKQSNFPTSNEGRSYLVAGTAMKMLQGTTEAMTKAPNSHSV